MMCIVLYHNLFCLEKFLNLFSCRSFQNVAATGFSVVFKSLSRHKIVAIFFSRVNSSSSSILSKRLFDLIYGLVVSIPANGTSQRDEIWNDAGDFWRASFATNLRFSRASHSTSLIFCRFNFSYFISSSFSTDLSPTNRRTVCVRNLAVAASAADAKTKLGRNKMKINSLKCSFSSSFFCLFADDNHR